MNAVEPLSILDERYLKSRVARRLARLVSVAVLDGYGLRDADGAVRMDLVREALRRSHIGVPRLRQVARGLPLGLMVPAWVFVPEADLQRLVRLHPHRVSADSIPVDLLAGVGSPELHPSRPLWSALVIDIDDGRIAIALSGHHAAMDGLRGLAALLGLLPDVAGMPPEPPAPGTPQAPRTPVGLAVGAFRTWWASMEGDPRAAWHDWARKPVTMRLRRMAGRIVGPGRDAVLAITGLEARYVPPRRHAYRTIDLGGLREVAREAGVSLNDAFVTAAGLAAHAIDPAAVGLLVPIADRGRRQADNGVRVARVELRRGSVAEQAPAVRDEVRRVLASGEAVVHPRGSWSGYATTIPGPPRPRYLVDAKAEEMFLWPSIGPNERYGVLGFTYCGRFVATIVTDGSIDPDALAEALEARLRSVVAA